ncbi:transposase [Nitrosomonas eutropha]|uniref:transposase n=1 Tax=Nitrosomonas eutropha TaxID=916 RepID=UPI00210D5E2E|nr:transposase [Nitrosomonas eutropha]
MQIDFLHFCGLSSSDAIPDETILCRFRIRLMVNDRLDGLLASINEQIQSHSLMVKGTTGAVIDAILIESAARPKKTITLEWMRKTATCAGCTPPLPTRAKWCISKQPSLARTRTSRRIECMRIKVQ